MKLILFVLTLFYFEVQAQNIAVTDDGTKVILNKDGTWRVIIDSSNSKNEFDFRNTKWGWSKAKVKKSEKLILTSEKDNYLAFSTKLSGLDVSVYYIFVENKLVRSKYVLDVSHTNKNDYILDYIKLKDLLLKKYGRPIQDEIYWSNDLYKDSFKDWGFAISLGHLSYYAQWSSENTTIYEYLNGENYDISCGIEYTSIELENLEKNKNEGESLNDL